MKRFALNALRLVLSFTFLWAFIDKLFGFGFATPHANAWIRGGSPTEGFLTHGVHGPFAGLYQSLAGSAVVDWLFMAGLLFIGLSLLTGILIRFASICGLILMVLMYLALIPPENNPLFDEHIVYALIFLLFYASARKKHSSEAEPLHD